MENESLLNEYLENARATQEKVSSSEISQRVETILTELKVPWTRDGDVWEINSDIGKVLAGLSDDEEVLSFWRLAFPLSKPAKKLGEMYEELLMMNQGTTGACWAVANLDGERWVVTIARISARSIDPPEIALTLSSVFELASVLE